jgi:hypothetical protein
MLLEMSEPLRQPGHRPQRRRLVMPPCPVCDDHFPDGAAIRDHLQTAHPTYGGPP